LLDSIDYKLYKENAPSSTIWQQGFDIYNSSFY
jgi:hypothetical protein